MELRYDYLETGYANTNNGLLMMVDRHDTAQLPIVVTADDIDVLINGTDMDGKKSDNIIRSLHNLFFRLGIFITKCEIYDFVDGNYKCRLWVNDYKNDTKIDMPAHDAVTLCIMACADMFVEEKVVISCGIDKDGLQREIENLTKQLEECEKREDYEKAEKIMEEINKIKNR